MNGLRIPIIIVNYKSSDKLINLLKSIEKNVKNINFHFFIADNSCDESELEKIKNFLSIRDKSYKNINYSLNRKNFLDEKPENYEYILFNMGKNYGYSITHNLMINLVKKLGYKNVFVSNPDILFTKDHNIESMLSIIDSRKEIACLYPKIITKTGTNQGPFFVENFYYQFFYKIFLPILYLPNKIYIKLKRKINELKNSFYYVYASIGSFFLLDLSFDNTFEFFDNKVFLYLEEQILSEKLKNEGKKLALYPKSILIHDHIYKINEISNNKNYKLSREYFYREYLGYSEKRIKMIYFADKIKNLYKKLYSIFKKD